MSLNLRPCRLFLPQRLPHLLSGDGQRRDAHADGIIDGVRNRRGHGEDGRLADATGAEWSLLIRLLHDKWFDGWEVETGRDLVVQEASGEGFTRRRVFDFFHQGMPDRLGHTTLDLALDILRINRTANIVSRDNAGQRYLAGLFVHLDFDNLCAKRVEGLRHAGREGTASQDGPRAARLGIAYQLAQRKTTVWRAFHKDTPATARQVGGIGFEPVRGQLQQLFTGIGSGALDRIPDRDCDATGRREHVEGRRLRIP